MSKFYALLILILVSSNVICQNFKFGKVSEEELLENHHPLNKDADAAVLYSFQRTYYDWDKNNGFKLMTEIHQRIKIYNKDGFDWATKEISLYEGDGDERVFSIKGITYNLVDGKISEEKLDNDEIFEDESSKYRKITKFTMPAVKEGSVIEFEYSISSPFIGAIDEIPLQYTIPINKLEISVAIPEYFHFGVYNNPRATFYVKIDQDSKPFRRNVSENVHSGSGFRQNTRTERGVVEFSQNIYRVDKQNIPALKLESHIDYINNYAAFLDWELQFTKFPNSVIENYSSTWEGVAKTIYTDGGYDQELKRTRFFEDDVDQLLSGISNPQQKAGKIFNFVKSKVKWNNYVGYYAENGLKDAYSEGTGNTGDINLLLTSMLRYAHLEAYPVLLSTPDNGTPVFPTRQGFNYVVAGVKLEDRVVLMDATDMYAAPGELPARARNWQGRIIREDGSSDWISLQPTKSEIRTQLSFQMEENMLKGKFSKIYKGLDAKNYRENYLNTKQTDYLHSLKEKMGEVNITDVSVENKEKFGTAIKETYNFELNNGMEVIDKNIYLKPLLFQAISENPFKAEDRYYPIFFDYPSLKRNTTSIIIPEGYEVTSVPENTIVKLNDNAGEFSYIIRQNGNFIRVESEININNTVFKATDFEYLKSFYSNIVEKQNEAIVLSKISTNGSKELSGSGR